MKRFQLLHVNSPLVEMECGRVKIQSEHIKDAKENPNFPEPVLSFDVVSSGFSQLVYYRCQQIISRWGLGSCILSLSADHR